MPRNCNGFTGYYVTLNTYNTDQALKMNPLHQNLHTRSFVDFVSNRSQPLSQYHFPGEEHYAIMVSQLSILKSECTNLLPPLTTLSICLDYDEIVPSSPEEIQSCKSCSRSCSSHWMSFVNCQKIYDPALFQRKNLCFHDRFVSQI